MQPSGGLRDWNFRTAEQGRFRKAAGYWALIVAFSSYRNGTKKPLLNLLGLHVPGRLSWEQAMPPSVA